MTVLAPRRAFLRGLASLPLIGGSVAILGQPTAVAEPISRAMLAQYWNWLFYERRLLCIEMANGDERRRRWIEDVCGGSVHRGEFRSADVGWVNSNSGIEPYSAELRYPEFHFPDGCAWTDVPKPSTRAALVMGAVDFDWRPTPKC